MTQLDVSQAIYTLDAAIAERRSKQGLLAPRTLDREEWPPNYEEVLAWRQQQLAKFSRDLEHLNAARAYYAGMDLHRDGITDPAQWTERCVDFINHWCTTFDPRNAGKHGKMVQMPLVLFRRQEDLVHFVLACLLADAPGLVEKARLMGATWTCMAISLWMWLFWPGVTIGWGANNLDLVDVLGESDSLLEKFRSMVRLTPDCFRPPVVEGVHLKHKTCRNPDNGAVLSGQGGKDIGRGGRRRIYFVDEAAHIENQVAVEASLSMNTRCRIDVSSVSQPGTVFHSKRMTGKDWVPGEPMCHDRANVFVMDLFEHPEHTRAWYDAERKRYYNQGTPEVVARELDRDYMGAAEGIIIHRDWVEAAVDAHLHLGFEDDGGYWGGLDLADEGRDKNALVRGRGVVVKFAEEMTERDSGVIARRVFRLCRDTSPITVQYDSGGGFGGPVKAEFNRLTMDDGVDTSWLKLVPWSAAAAVSGPGEPIIKGDKSAPTNKNYFENFKAQAWWNVARMFHRTWQAINGEAEYGADQLISLDSSSIPEPTLQKLMRELSQATASQSSRLKMLINKAPEGMKSPNLADALIMGRFPAKPQSVLGTFAGPLDIGPKIIRA